MARFNFRHGMARRQEDGFGNPAFLQPSNGGQYVDLIVSTDPTVFVIAHYDADYMVTENVTVSQAWGPFSAGTDYWLYWDVDFVTGALTRGFTTLQPVDDPNAPSSPSVDQHWFDMTENVQKVWTGSAWVEKIRLFASKYASGSTLFEQPIGSQVGLNNIVTYAGAILFDPDGSPLQKFQRNRRGQFITTETDLNSQLSRIANFRVEAAVVQGEAQEEIPLHHAIGYFDYDKLVLARNGNPAIPAIGISMEEMNTNEVRSFITKGYVTNEIDWDWSAYPAGTPLFVGPAGELIPNPPTTVSLQQIATVVNPTTVFVDVKQIVQFIASGNLIPVQLDRNTGSLIANNIEAGALTLGGLSDVTLDLPPADGEVLTYDSLSDEWINAPSTSTPPAGFLQVWGYEHTQPTASTIWTIAHNLGTDKVVTKIYDTSNEEVFPNGVTILDVNTIQVDFFAAQDGRAQLLLFV